MKQLTLTKKILIILMITSTSFIIGITGCKKEEDKEEEQQEEVTPTTFCYSLTTNNSQYDTIAGGTKITAQHLNNDDYYEINLGFDFKFCDQTFQKLYLTTNYSPFFSYQSDNEGFIHRSYELIPFGDLYLNKKWGALPGGGYGYVSSFLYSTTGNTGERVTTIEWRNYEYSEFGDTTKYNVNFQVSLYENGNIIYHFGENDLTIDFSASTDIYYLGLYANSSDVGLYLYGSPDSPSTKTSRGTSRLNAWPDNGTKYTFQ